MNQDIGRSALKFRPAPAGPPTKPVPPLRGSLPRAAIALAVLLLTAVLLGGGGVRYGLMNLVVQLTALVILAACRDRFVSFWRDAPLALKLLAGVSLALPIIQLIPLPLSVWTALPGRTLAFEARQAAGIAGWAPLSLDSARTFVALSGLIVPLTLLAIGWTLSTRALLMLGLVLVVLAVAQLVPGIPQALSEKGNLSFYAEQPMKGVLFGTFANRNSAGLFLVAGLAFAVLLPSPVRHPFVLPARIGIAALIVVAIILTKSRTALVLAMIPLGLAALRLLLDILKGASGKRSVLALAGGTLAVLAGGALLLTLSPGRLGDALDRFAGREDPRAFIWEDTVYAAQRYWPVGAGMGTFDEVFQIDESLENMTMRRAGRAHNDYLEIAVEAGAPGLALVSGWALLTLWLAWLARYSPHRWAAWSGAAVLAIIALQSITDYPLRNQTMLAVAGLAFAILARGALARRQGEP